MIVKNKKNSVLITIVGMILVVAIAISGCTGAVLPSKAQQPSTSPAVSQKNTPGPSDSTVFTLKDGSVTVNIPQGWHAQDISNGAEYSMGQMVSGDGKNIIEINCNRTGETNVTPESAINQTMYITSEGEKGEVSVSQNTIMNISSNTGAAGQTAYVYSIKSGPKIWTFDLQNSLGEALTVNGIEGKLYDFNSTNEDGKGQGRMAVFAEKGKVYSISYFAESENFEKNKSLLEGVISSAKFNPDTEAVFTLKDGSMSVTVPEGWMALDTSDDTTSYGCITSKDTNGQYPVGVSIATREQPKGENETPDSIIKNNAPLSFMGGKIGEIYPSITSGNKISVDGIEGKRYGLSAISSSYEMYGDLQVFVGNGKEYLIVYIADKDDYNKNKDTLEKIALSAKFN